MTNRPTDLNVERLRTEIDQMIEALTHPAYVEAMRAVRATPIEQRLQAGSRLLNPEALRRQGVPLPENMRISSRYFDETFPTGVEFGDAPDRGINIVNALNEAQPGLLDRLQRDNRTLFEEIVSAVTTPTRFRATAGCCCGGVATGCAGCGGIALQ